MNLKPDEEKLVPLTRYEIVLTMDLLRKIIPSKDDETTVINIVNKLKRAAGS